MALPQATARQTLTLASAAQCELEQSCPHKASETFHDVNPNASRAIYRSLQRYGLCWNVPVTELKHPVGSNRFLTIPYLRPLESLAFYLQKCPELLCGGESVPEKMSQQLVAFWGQYKGYHPEHRVFQEHQHSLSRVVPLCLHGDEGRGLRKGNCSVLSWESPLGLNSAKRTSFTCSCPVSGPMADRLGAVEGPEVSAGLADSQCTNLQFHSFLTRGLAYAVHSRQHKEAEDLI